MIGVYDISFSASYLVFSFRETILSFGKPGSLGYGKSPSDTTIWEILFEKIFVGTFFPSASKFRRKNPRYWLASGVRLSCWDFKRCSFFRL